MQQILHITSKIISVFGKYYGVGGSLCVTKLQNGIKCSPALGIMLSKIAPV